MADSRVFSQQYGNFGEATYDIDEHEWHFDRPLTGIIFRPLDQETNEEDAAQDAVDNARNPPEPNTAERIKDIDDIINPRADFDGSKNLFRSLLEASEAIVSATDEYDSSLGNRIATGWIVSAKLRRPIALIANVSGPGGSNVNISRLCSFRQGWNDDEHSWLRTPKPTGNTTTWRGPGAPIQQVCMPAVAATEREDVDSRSLEPIVAIRQLDRTTILLIRDEDQGLDVFTAIDIITDRQHAHVSFNPWFGRQLAIIGINRSWCVWEVEGIRRLHAKPIIQNELDEHSAADLNDGWARINFVGAPDVVAVSTRRRILLYDIGRLERLPELLQLRFRKDADVVLDVAVLPSHTGHILILTTNCLIIYFVLKDEDGIKPHHVLSVHHYANPEDISLHMVTFMSKGDIMIWIRSRITRFSILYKISNLHRTHCKCYGPYACENAAPSRQYKTADLAVAPVHYIVSENANEEGTLSQADAQGIELQQMFSITPDYELRHSIRILCSSGIDIQLFPPEWERKHQSSGKDRVVEGDEVRSISVRQAAIIARERRLRLKKEKLKHIHLAHIGQQLDNPLENLQDLASALDTITQDLQNATHEKPLPFSRLTDLVDEGHTAQIDDLKDTAARLQQMLEEPLGFAQESDNTAVASDENQLKIEPIALPASSFSAALSDPSAIYDSIVADWIKPLKSQVDGRIRRQKNRIAENMTAELVLAGNIVRPVLKQMPNGESLSFGESGTQVESDFEASSIDKATTATQDSIAALSLGPPTPTSFVSGPTQPLASRPYHIEQYTTFSRPLPSLSRDVQNMLLHWEVGQDPEHYDYNLYDSLIRQEIEDETDRSLHSDRDIEKRKKREERRLRRQKAQDEASQQERMMNAQRPILALSASQPADGRRPGARTQQDLTQATQGSQYPAAASQIQPGRHGGRPTKRKARQAGF